MAFAAADLIPFEDHLAVLTDEIFQEIGSREKLADDKARAEAVARVEKLLARYIISPSQPEPTCDEEDCAADIAFGRQDAEFAFEERLDRA